MRTEPVSALVILGAGASFDSVAPHSLAADRNLEMHPPLANHLFDNRIAFADILQRIPHMGAIAGTLRDRIVRGAALEDELALLETDAETEPRAAQQLMAVRFYLQEVIRMCGDSWLQQSRRSTNFHILVDHMVRWNRRTKEPVLFVTFNYDTMLERALEDELSCSFKEMASYTGRDDVKVFKLHGSVNWGHRGQSARIAQSGMPAIIERAYDLLVPETFDVKESWNVSQSGEFWVPALAVPVRNKLHFECPEEHRQTLHDLLPTVDRVLIIGWAGMEQHFQKVLRERLRREQNAVIIACGGVDGSAAIETWDRFGDMGDGRLVTVTGPFRKAAALTFSDLFADSEFQSFLRV
jgi:SIR2-like domain